MERYTEILKLKEMLEKANIPFTFTDDLFGAKKEGEVDSKKYPAYQIRLNKDIDVVQHCYSYGEEKNLLEIMGGLTEEEGETDGVLGNLMAEEVFKRFKYCYENGTAVYKVENLETKTKQEQINELAVILCKHIMDCGEIDCKTCPFKGCMSQRQAKEILDRGYRKASDVIDEFVQKLGLKFAFYEAISYNADCEEVYHDLFEEIDEIADEMRKEVEK